MLRSDAGKPSAEGPVSIVDNNAATVAMGNQYARLRRLIDLSPAGIIESDEFGIIRFTNARWDTIRGADTPDAGTALADILVPACKEDYEAAVAELQAGAQQAATELAFHRADGTVFYASSSFTALADTAGAFAGIAGIFIDVSERVLAERKVRASEARLRQILDNTVALIGIMLPDGTLIEANKAALRAGGLDRTEVVGKKFWDCYWWSYDQTIMAQLKAAIELAATGQEQRFDIIVRMENDVLIPIDFMLSPVLDDDGNVELLVPSGFDISDRKRSEDQLAFVMREVNHRSKNMLAVVQSILRQMRPDDVGQFVRDFGARLRALAACQDLLVSSSDDCPDLMDLVQNQLNHFENLPGTRLHMSGPVMRVSPEVAQSLGMAIYELATNAGKYGALSNTTGQIDIAWKIAADPDGQVFDLRWQESGGPTVFAPNNKGFGTVVLEDMLTMSLDATTQIKFEPSGLVWTLRCPVQSILAK